MFLAQPVQDELEYIKMRYRSPAARTGSFRERNYETLASGATYSTGTSTGGGGSPRSHPAHPQQQFGYPQDHEQYPPYSDSPHRVYRMADQDPGFTVI